MLGRRARRRATRSRRARRSAACGARARRAAASPARARRAARGSGTSASARRSTIEARSATDSGAAVEQDSLDLEAAGEVRARPAALGGTEAAEVDDRAARRRAARRLDEVARPRGGRGRRTSPSARPAPSSGSGSRRSRCRRAPRRARRRSTASPCDDLDARARRAPGRAANARTVVAGAPAGAGISAAPTKPVAPVTRTFMHTVRSLP